MPKRPIIAKAKHLSDWMGNNVVPLHTNRVYNVLFNICVSLPEKHQRLNFAYKYMQLIHLQ